MTTAAVNLGKILVAIGDVVSEPESDKGRATAIDGNFPPHELKFLWMCSNILFNRGHSVFPVYLRPQVH